MVFPPQKHLSSEHGVRLMVDLVHAGLLLVIAGFGIMVASMLNSRSKEGGRVQGGGVIMVGPIPIIFGSDAKWASVAVVLAIILILLTLLLYLV
jgi:uncharacterized protein (TIGR00304 family)